MRNIGYVVAVTVGSIRGASLSARRTVWLGRKTGGIASMDFRIGNDAVAGQDELTLPGVDVERVSAVDEDDAVLDAVVRYCLEVARD